MSSISGNVTPGVRWIVNSAGQIVGYRNPATDQDEAASSLGVKSITPEELAAPTAAMLADTKTFYELQTTKSLYRSNGTALELVGGAAGNGSTSFPEYSMPASNLATVGSITPTSPGGTPANEYLTTAGAYTSTDGSNSWGLHQNRMVRMSDGTLFAVVWTTTNLLLMRSATGGTYGSAWTTVATISNASRDSNDLDAHLLRNPVMDHVHLIASDSAGATYRIRTYNSAGTLLNDSLVPNRWPGGPAASAVGWMVLAGSQNPHYSSAGIGPDGTIFFRDSISAGTYNGRTYTQTDAALRYAFWKWNGATWSFSRIYTQDVGQRFHYDRVFVSPPGNEGYVVGISHITTKFNEWSALSNPNYPGPGIWPNTDADTSYFGTGRFPEIIMYKIRIDDPTVYTQQRLVEANYRTSDIPASPTAADYGAYTMRPVHCDNNGRFWICSSRGDWQGQTTQRNLYVFSPAGVQLYAVTNVAGATQGYSAQLHEKLDGGMLLFWWGSGAAMDCRIPTITESGGSLVVQTLAAAANQAAGAATALFGNLATSRYEEGGDGVSYMPGRSSGSVLTDNFFDLMYMTAGDHTGTAPGTTPATAADGSVKVKRVRVQVPVT